MHDCFTFGRFHVRNQTAECLVVLLRSSGKRWEIFQNTRRHSLLVKTAVCTGLHWLSSIPFHATWHKKLIQRCKLQTAAEREYTVNETGITTKPIKNTRISRQNTILLLNKSATCFFYCFVTIIRPISRI